MPLAAARLKSGSATTNSPLERDRCRRVSAASFAMGDVPKSNTLTTGRWLGCEWEFADDNASRLATRRKRRIRNSRRKLTYPHLSRRFASEDRGDGRGRTLPFSLPKGNTLDEARKDAGVLSPHHSLR